MADATYDAVIIGGGCKALSAAIYLTKYGGMTVGVFERRHELGGGLCSHEAPAPGFIGDPHATNTNLGYYPVVEEDFPDFIEKGGKQAHYKASTGVITRENQKCCTIYHLLEDPTQEKTAREITRFSGEKDAETYLKIWDYASKSHFDIVANQQWFNLPPPLGEPSPEERWLTEWFKQPDCPVDPEWRILSPIVAAQQLFDSFGVPLIWLRRGLASGMQPIEPFGGLDFIRWMLAQPGLCFIEGGTHSVAHAYIRIFLENGGKFFTHSHVDKIIIDNGTAKGIRLSDGTEIQARKAVLSTASPHQLCFQLLGNEHLSQRILKKVKHLVGGSAAISWATWAHRDPVNFKAADFNPDINNTQNVTLGSEDPELWYQEYYLRKLGKIPPIEGTILHHAYTGVDRSRVMPEDGHTCLTETFLPAANALTEQEWLEYKKTYMEDVVREWEVYTTNMTWDNIIGCDPIMPYDTAARLINMAPWGDWSIYNIDAWRPMSMRPIAEFAHHRIANIKNLYGTGAPWGQGSGMADAGYKAYKAIAEDLGLRKPWDEKGRPY